MRIQGSPANRPKLCYQLPPANCPEGPSKYRQQIVQSFPVNGRQQIVQRALQSKEALRSIASKLSKALL